jgi:hypothetical protein
LRQAARRPLPRTLGRCKCRVEHHGRYGPSVERPANRSSFAVKRSVRANERRLCAPAQEERPGYAPAAPRLSEAQTRRCRVRFTEVSTLPKLAFIACTTIHVQCSRRSLRSPRHEGDFSVGQLKQHHDLPRHRHAAVGRSACEKEALAYRPYATGTRVKHRPNPSIEGTSNTRLAGCRLPLMSNVRPPNARRARINQGPSESEQLEQNAEGARCLAKSTVSGSHRRTGSGTQGKCSGGRESERVQFVVEYRRSKQKSNVAVVLMPTLMKSRHVRPGPPHVSSSTKILEGTTHARPPSRCNFGLLHSSQSRTLWCT